MKRCYSLACLLLMFLSEVHSDMSQEIKVREISNDGQRCILGEGPHWDIKSQSLFYVDIVAPSIYRLNTKNGEIYKAKIKDNDEPIGFMIPVDGTTDEFVVGAGREVVVIRWDGRSALATVVRVLGDVDKNITKNRINDGKCDPSGRLYFGTMGDENADLKANPTGSFYRFKTAEAPTTKLKSLIGISNGLTWNETLGKFYYIDSVARDVKVFDYDSSSGNITNEAVLIDFDKILPAGAFPDGMTIDENGNLYVATWGGSKIFVIDPKEKKIVEEIELPTSQVTSVAFGGPNLDVLYVTTAAKSPSPIAPAGGLFKITGLGVKGLPMNNFKLY